MKADRAWIKGDVFISPGNRLKHRPKPGPCHFPVNYFHSLEKKYCDNMAMTLGSQDYMRFLLVIMALLFMFSIIYGCSVCMIKEEGLANSITTISPSSFAAQNKKAESTTRDIITEGCIEDKLDKAMWAYQVTEPAEYNIIQHN